MKVFLVFLAILVIASALFVFQGDFQTYRYYRSAVKRLAEECALAACEYRDEDAYSRGTFVFSETEGEKAVSYLVTEANERFRSVREGILTYEIKLYDDEKGLMAGKSEPASLVTVTYTTEDFFRLPFLRKTQIVRTGEYSVKQY